MTSRALVPLSSEELQNRDQKLLALRPDLERVPIKARWATLTLAHRHGLDPFRKHIIPIETRGKWEPYVTLLGARANAERQGLKFGRVLSPLSDKWCEEFFGLTAVQMREAMELDPEDMVWVCGIYVDGNPYPFVHLGVVGPTFIYKGSTPKWNMCAIRAERPALLAACNLPYTAGVDAGEADTNGLPAAQEESVVEGEVRVMAERPNEIVDMETDFYWRAATRGRSATTLLQSSRTRQERSGEAGGTLPSRR
jgi:hypothetical protein